MRPCVCSVCVPALGVYEDIVGHGLASVRFELVIALSSKSGLRYDFLPLAIIKGLYFKLIYEFFFKHKNVLSHHSLCLEQCMCVSVMCVCMYVCMYVCKCNVCMHVCVYVWV